MTKRVLHDIVFLVRSPSYYVAEAMPSVRIFYAGDGWGLTCGRGFERHPSLDAAAAKLRAAVDLAMLNINQAQEK